MKSDLFSKVSCVKLCNGLKVYYRGCFCAKAPCFSDMSCGGVRKTPANVQLCMTTEELSSLQFPGKCCASTQGAAPELVFPLLLQLVGDLTYLCQTWCQQELAQSFQPRAVNTMEISFSALTCEECQLLHTGMIFQLSIGKGSGPAASWLIVGSLNTPTVQRVIFIKLI